MNKVRSAIEARSEFFLADAPASDALGHLTDEAAAAMREVGIIKMLQPKACGGFESHPVDFLQAVHRLASYNPGAGWVGGVVGLHPWEVAQMDDAVQKAVWGESAEVWVSSPYAPIGRSERVADGFVFSGRWPFASGTDHCEWALLGGIDSAEPCEAVHYVVPQADYTRVPGSWDVVGLKGSGSKDLTVTDAFVPEKFTIPFREVSHGNATAAWEKTAPLYRMPYVVLFPGAITAATLGIAQGALDRFVEAVQGRPQADAQLITIARAAADIENAARILFADTAEVFDAVSAGQSIPVSQRIKVRRNQVAGVRRAVEGVNSLFQISGSLGLRNNTDFSRFWRDANVGGNHATNSPDPILRGYALDLFGEEVPEVLRMGPVPTQDSL